MTADFSPFGTDLFGQPIGPTDKGGPLAQRFILPPFSVLSAREGVWQERKAAWLGLGIRSEEGRGENDGGDAPDKARMLRKQFTDWMADKAGGNRGNDKGTSVFDPVLCELVYRWFCPQGGMVLDPFAGGSVRGVVAAMLGRRYHGIELRPEQVAANRQQAAAIVPPAMDADAQGVTPIETHGGYLVKRDDVYRIGGAAGGKARTCWALAQGAKGLTTAGSRHSPQAAIVARVARRLGIPCAVHVPTGEETAEMRDAVGAGAQVVQHRPGYNSVIIARAREDAAARGWLAIPFGMDSPAAVEQTAAQVPDTLPPGVKRIVVPVGSGMTLAGILHGLLARGHQVPVLGVVVGADPTSRLDASAPAGWRDMVTLVPSGVPYGTPPATCRLGDLDLDPVYEAHAAQHLVPGDLLWVVGIRPSAAPALPPACAWVAGDARDHLAAAPDADLVFTCPPYGDLERYSDDPRDLSTYTYPQFRAALRDVLLAAAARLRQDRFLAVVVGEYRDRKTGLYHGWVPDLVADMRAAGLGYYNHAVVVTPVGSLPIRTANQFRASRKMGKTHQDLVVFVKGNAFAATKAIGNADIEEEETPQ